MKTLVIHPEDPTTDFLCEIYRDKGYKVVRKYVLPNDLRVLLWKYDRIIMLGHGTPKGLLFFNEFMITKFHADILRKKECVFVWCNSDQFVQKPGIKGFFTGMFISEMLEAMYCDVEAEVEDIEQSNRLFSKLVREEGFDAEKVKKGYHLEDNAVLEYNKERIYQN